MAGNELGTLLQCTPPPRTERDSWPVWEDHCLSEGSSWSIETRRRRECWHRTIPSTWQRQQWVHGNQEEEGALASHHTQQRLLRLLRKKIEGSWHDLSLVGFDHLYGEEPSVLTQHRAHTHTVPHGVGSGVDGRDHSAIGVQSQQ